MQRFARGGVGSLCVAAVSAVLCTAGAQTGPSVTIAPVYQAWSFATPLPLDSLRVKSATQIAVPFMVEWPVSSRLTTTLSGAAYSSNVSTPGAGSGESQSLSGLTDLRIRATGRVIGDALRITAGINIPTGKSGLSLSENQVVRVLAAPSLGAPVAIPGVGFGGTIGAVAATLAGQWALAVGASLEKRGTYSPLDVAIAGRDARTELVPGNTAHVSFGADGLVGAHRLSIGVLTDLYSSDQLRSITNGTTQTDSYKLGPTALATASLQIASSAIRDLTVQFTDRYRSAFTDGKGATIAGSSGNSVMLGASGLLGSAGRPSLVLGVDVQQHSGLPVDKGLIGAKMTGVGATVGLSLPSGTIEWRPTLHASVGSMTTQRASSSVTSFSAGLTVVARK